jgi:hypothetical protein
MIFNPLKEIPKGETGVCRFSEKKMENGLQMFLIKNIIDKHAQ